MNHFNSFWLSFIPLFVAIDVLAVVPLYLTFTEGLNESEKKKLLTASTLTALGISVIFLGAGKMLFLFLGITENDFRIGGGILLLVFSVKDLLFNRFDERRKPDSSVGVVPIGIPLIIGPAALTTILISVDAYGYPTTLLSLALNLSIVWIAFRYSRFILKVMGKSGSTAFARVMSIFLAAIAVMMIRVGVTNTLMRFGQIAP